MDLQKSLHLVPAATVAPDLSLELDPLPCPFSCLSFPKILPNMSLIVGSLYYLYEYPVFVSCCSILNIQYIRWERGGRREENHHCYCCWSRYLYNTDNNNNNVYAGTIVYYRRLLRGGPLLLVPFTSVLLYRFVYTTLYRFERALTFNKVRCLFLSPPRRLCFCEHRFASVSVCLSVS